MSQPIPSDDQPIQLAFLDPPIAPSPLVELIPDDNPYQAPDKSLKLEIAPSGPTIFEAIVWFFGFLGVHLVGGILAFVLAIIYAVASQGIDPGNRAEFSQMIEDMTRELPIGVVLGEMLFFVAIAVGAALLRSSPRPLSRLGFRTIRISHLVLIITGAFPLMLFCGSLHVHLNHGWEAIIENVPLLKNLHLTNTNELMKNLAGAPFALLLLAIAVCPAIGEEIVFRGVIGRGLVTRYGVVWGVFLTSCFFAAAHVHPAHALAVLPLGAYAHITYLATRSFWAPVLVHFINNGVAVCMLGIAERLKGSAVDDEAQPVSLMLIAGAIALGTAVTLWKSRVEHASDDGSIWNPGFMTVEPPPAQYGVRTLRPVNNWLYGAALASGLMMTGLFVISVAMALK